MSKNRTSRFMPVIVAVSIVTGILIGTFYANHFSGNKLGIINTSSNKLNALLRIIDDQYVDTVNMGELVEDAMPQILGELDPHSSIMRSPAIRPTFSDGPPWMTLFTWMVSCWMVNWIPIPLKLPFKSEFTASRSFAGI